MGAWVWVAGVIIAFLLLNRIVLWLMRGTPNQRVSMLTNTVREIDMPRVARLANTTSDEMRVRALSVFPEYAEQLHPGVFAAYAISLLRRVAELEFETADPREALALLAAHEKTIQHLLPAFLQNGAPTSVLKKWDSLSSAALVSASATHG